MKADQADGMNCIEKYVVGNVYDEAITMRERITCSGRGVQIVLE